MPIENEPDFDKELDAILAGPEGDEGLVGQDPTLDQSAPAPAQTQPDQAAKFKYGGREWDSHESLGKAYESLLKDYSRKGAALTEKEKKLQEAEKWHKWGQAIEKHPELRTSIEDRIQEFNKRIQAGQSRAQAGQATGVDPAFVSRFKQMEAYIEDQRLGSEINEVKTKYSLSNEEMGNVLREATRQAQAGKLLSLDEVYRITAFEKVRAEALKTAEQKALENLKSKSKANTSDPSAAGVTPSAKDPRKMSGEEYNQELSKQLEQLGYSD